MDRRTMARFFSKVHHVRHTGCWVWVGAVSAGYGQFSRDGSSTDVGSAHAFLYEALYGPVPDGYELDHNCLNKRCVCPAHLDVVTHQENCRRWRSLVTHCRNGHLKLGDNVRRTKANNASGFANRCVICTRETAKRWAQKNRAAREAMSA